MFVPSAQIENEDNLDQVIFADLTEYEELERQMLRMKDRPEVIPCNTRMRTSLKKEDDRLNHPQRIQKGKNKVAI